MEEMKHTPGPWRIGTAPPNGEQTIGTIRGMMVAVATTGVGMEEETLANARLIAAAPELLEALKLAANALDKMGDMPDSDVSPHAWFSLDCENIVENSKSLIAKATGQSK